MEKEEAKMADGGKRKGRGEAKARKVRRGLLSPSEAPFRGGQRKSRGA